MDSYLRAFLEWKVEELRKLQNYLGIERLYLAQLRDGALLTAQQGQFVSKKYTPERFNALLQEVGNVSLDVVGAINAIYHNAKNDFLIGEQYADILSDRPKSEVIQNPAILRIYAENIKDGYASIQKLIGRRIKALKKLSGKDLAELGINMEQAKSRSSRMRFVNLIISGLQTAGVLSPEEAKNLYLEKFKEVFPVKVKTQELYVFDSAGRKWKPETYALLLARTTPMEAFRLGSMAQFAKYGVDLVRLTDDVLPNTCEACKKWAGKEFSLFGKTKGMPTLEDLKKDGVFHPNCIHTWTIEPQNPERLEKEAKRLEKEIIARKQKEIEEAKKKEEAIRNPQPLREGKMSEEEFLDNLKRYWLANTAMPVDMESSDKQLKQYYKKLNKTREHIFKYAPLMYKYGDPEVVNLLFGGVMPQIAGFGAIPKRASGVLGETISVGSLAAPGPTYLLLALSGITPGNTFKEYLKIVYGREATPIEYARQVFATMFHEFNHTIQKLGYQYDLENELRNEWTAFLGRTLNQQEEDALRRFVNTNKISQLIKDEFTPLLLKSLKGYKGETNLTWEQAWDTMFSSRHARQMALNDAAREEMKKKFKTYEAYYYALHAFWQSRVGYAFSNPAEFETTLAGGRTLMLFKKGSPAWRMTEYIIQRDKRILESFRRNKEEIKHIKESVEQLRKHLSDKTVKRTYYLLLKDVEENVDYKADDTYLDSVAKWGLNEFYNTYKPVPLTSLEKGTQNILESLEKITDGKIGWAFKTVFKLLTNPEDLLLPTYADLETHDNIFDVLLEKAKLLKTVNLKETKQYKQLFGKIAKEISRTHYQMGEKLRNRLIKYIGKEGKLSMQHLKLIDQLLEEASKTHWSKLSFEDRDKYEDFILQKYFDSIHFDEKKFDKWKKEVGI